MQNKANPLLHLMIFNWLLGMAAGLLCAAIVLVVDVGGLRTLLVASDMMWTGVLLLFGGFALTFGGVVCATAVMMLAPGDGEARSDDC